MSGIRKIFATDQSVEVQGVWQDYGNGVEICLARSGGSNRAFAKRFNELTKPHRRIIQAEAVDEAVATTILYRVYAETVVRGWKGITADDLDSQASKPDEPVTFTVGNCIKLFEALPDLFADVVAQSGRLAMYRQADREADSKNS